MINSFIGIVLEVIIGFSTGIAVGGGFVAFIMLLGMIPRLMQLSETEHLLKVYIACLIIGVFVGTYFTFTGGTLNQPQLLLSFWGLFHGIFNGMIIAALAEVLNIFPVIFRRIGMQRYLFALLMAIIFGKVFGSLFQWTIFP